MKYLYICCGLCVLLACSKTFEKEPLERITDDLVFDNIDKNADYAKQFLYGTYAQLPDGYNRLSGAFLDAGTDDGLHSQDGNSIENFRNGRINALNVVDNQWSRNYTGIRRANMFLSKIDRVPADSALKSQWKAEARFLRAYFYFELLKRWGGVPLLGDKVLGLNDNLNLPRNTADEVLQYITSELDAIRSSLLPAVLADKDWGRANLGAALALKARVLLYAASPLLNPANAADKWQLAANAARDVMQLNAYSLNADFIALFNAVKNTEIIFMLQKAQSQTLESNNGPVGYLVGSGLT
ncbi:MAG TPA: RagB/SusD family nutrient uptake outer membrane protein, partial [Phnomibacter sp.]|nr:RagB/SusD family nutrient uptake outer membrane protein [Phnomibacter sp.]